MPRRTSEEELKHTISLLNAAMESTADGLLVVDRQRRIAHFNQKFASMWRLPSAILESRDDEQALAWVLDQLEHPEVFLARVHELYQRPEAESFDIIEFKDGRVFERFSKPQRLDDQFIGRVWSFRDMTSYYQVKSALEKSEAQFRATFELAGVAKAQVDPRDGLFTRVNSKMCELTGYSADELLQMTFPQITHPDDRASDLEKFQQTFRGETPLYETEKRYVRKDGRVIWVAVVASLIRDACFQPVTTIAVIFDITARKQFEASLKESEARKTAILESALDSIVTIDHEGKIREFNLTAERTFGHRQADVIGREMAEVIIPPHLRAAHRRGLAHYLATGEGPVLGKRIELSAVRADGTEFPVELSVVRIQGSSPPMFTGFIRDITDRKREEDERSGLIRELKLAVSLRDTFLSVASHELKTPLTALIMQIQIIHRQVTQGTLAQLPREKALALLKSSERQLKRLSALINALLDASRISAGRLTLTPEPINLAELVHEVVERFRIELDESGCVVEERIDREIIGRWDRMRLDQIIVNLLSNAMKYGAGKRIVLSAEKRRGGVSFSVKDHGIGISKEDQERIFERFERAATSQSFAGIGLGLFIVRQIVEAHHGSIRVESELGQGSTFTVDLSYGMDA